MFEIVIADKGRDDDGTFVMKSTPCGTVRVGATGGGQVAIVSGDGVPTATVPIRPSLVGVARGLEANVDGHVVRVHRPKYGLRYRDRDVLVEGGELSMRCRYLGSRRLVFEREDGSVLFQQKRAKTFLAEDVTPSEVSLCLALFSSQVVQGSTLWDFLTF